MNSPLAHDANREQADYWNGPAGERWVQQQPFQDRLLAPLLDRLIAACFVAPGERAIDVGCGCGATTLALAASTGASGRALGLDVSAPMIARAQQRAAEAGLPAQFALADAALHDFSAERADLMVSRLGVMFFGDPALAFANMRAGLKPGGRLAFVCWREAKLNPWLMLPYRAVTMHAPKLPPAEPNDPGAFSFADEARVRHILGEAGFADVTFTPHDLEIDIAAGQGLEAAVAGSLAIGPASRALRGQPEDVRRAAEAEVREALRPYLQGQRLPLAAAIWLVKARNL